MTLPDTSLIRAESMYVGKLFSWSLLQFSQRQSKSSGITFFLQSGQLKYKILSSLKMILMYPEILKNFVAEGRLPGAPLELFFYSSRSSSMSLKLSLRSTEAVDALDPGAELVVPFVDAPLVTVGAEPVTELKLMSCCFLL
jgi:hypothetical protein